jgi:hypothetical protein
MGCDIHGYIDYDQEINKDRIYTRGFAKVNIDRNYALFTVLAGVRAGWDENPKNIGSPNGIPENRSWTIDWDLFVRVDDEYPDQDHTCSTKEAESWARCNSHLMHQGYKDEEKLYVLHPDWHSHSYMSIQELSTAIRKYNAICKKAGWDGTAPADIKAVLASMRALKAQGLEPRFVFWFDN